MSVPYDALRNVVLEYVRKNPLGRQLNLVGDNFFRARAMDLGHAYTDDDDCRVQEIFHELYLERIIVPGAGPKSSEAMKWPFFRVTEYGKEVLKQDSYVPNDPSGYLGLLKQEIPSIDEVIIMYLEEALHCFKVNRLLAAAVMLGCAAEKGILALVEALGNSIADDSEKKKYEKATKSWMISHKYTAMWKKLQEKLPQLPPDLTDDLHTLLDRAFDLIRTTRNDAGHPTGKRMDIDAVRANFILFPSYCRRIYALVKHFREKKL